jgi:hypothetical protein
VVHEQSDNLYKFCAADEALRMLDQRSLTFQGPSLLLDPFQPDHNTSLGFTRDELLSALIRQVVVLIFAQKAPDPPDNTLTRAICRWRDEQRFDIEEEAEEVLRDLLERMVEQQEDSINELMHDWQQYARHVRVCRFFEKNNSLHTWEVFADQHAGVALKFRCGLEYSIANARPVQYHDAPPMITTLKEQLDSFFLVQPFSYDEEAFELKLCTQPRHRRLDREWRAFIKQPAIEAVEGEEQPPMPWHCEQEFKENDLAGVYLGLSTPENVAQQITDLVRSEFPQTKIYQAQRHKGQYALEFDRIKR